ncbi:MAG: M2 family metallopeptidase [Sedimentisphaerales bacterium]|nr:M2 family metallopeptidase [Sedimentisphaerales bacterium]HNY77378.1 M2 family metallopeptidase [Sedimentisphaerales bacterium]HOC62019.1 M2 family metallopeptidase [Sedimentisphaerales bacterium]HOH66090.1 M2 family metallopeptidase [Sedimentisphaerales bacterium]HPY50666.1 M2 family metallopeptidase [Sedimentisphaerales bacterium]
MRQSCRTCVLLLVGVAVCGCGPDKKERDLQLFVTNHVAKIKPIEKEAALASWNAAITGDANDYDLSSELTLQLRRIYSNPDEFAFLKALRASGDIRDPMLARQLDVLYNKYLTNQIEPALLEKIVALGTEIEKRFSTFRGVIDGENVTDNEIKTILKEQTNRVIKKQAWEASKQVGQAVAADLIRLVKLRNQAAQELGFDNYHTLVLATGEQDVNDLDRLFNELYELTDAPFARLKSELDQMLAARSGIAVQEMMPWDYHDPFFQETPMVYSLDLDVSYKDKDVRELAKAFYAGVGLPVDAILARSDLYEKEGKNQHAFCTDIDREGDVRILCNLVNNETWMETLLHELGHGVYDLYHDPEVPYLLREPAHAFTTEAIAMLFGRLSRDPAWMQAMLNLSDRQRAEIAAVSDKYAQLKQLIFARWAMVMYFFEKQLYADPDQDLDALWWDLVEKYQLVQRPPRRHEPDWAAKIHFTIAPCYYHNYMLGELLASQLHHHLVHKVLKLDAADTASYVGKPKVGRFLKKKVFEAGDVYPWNTMIERATGEPLSPRYFVEQFVK